MGFAVYLGSYIYPKNENSLLVPDWAESWGEKNAFLDEKLSLSQWDFVARNWSKECYNAT